MSLLLLYIALLQSLMIGLLILCFGALRSLRDELKEVRNGTRLRGR